jgi:serine protease Do
MKNVLIGFLLLASATAFAQNDAEAPNNKQNKNKKTRSEVTITRDGEKVKNLTVEINGNEVKINGKIMADFNDEDVKVKIRNFEFNEELAALESLDPNDIANIDIDGNGDVKVKTKPGVLLGIYTKPTEDNKGALVDNVMPNSAAQIAGIKTGDVILTINSKPVTTSESIKEIISAKKAGEDVVINLLRDGKEQQVTAKLKENKAVEVRVKGYGLRGANGRGNFAMPSMPGMPPMPRVKQFNFDNNDIDIEGMVDGNMFWGGNRPKIGLKLTDIEDGAGVKVLGTEEATAAAKAGFEKDDIITEIDGVKIANTDDARKALKTDKTKTNYKVKFTRNGKQKETEIKILKKLKTVDL